MENIVSPFAHLRPGTRLFTYVPRVIGIRLSCVRNQVTLTFAICQSLDTKSKVDQLQGTVERSKTCSFDTGHGRIEFEDWIDP